MLCVVNCVADCIRFAVPQPTEWQRIGNQIDATMIFAGAHFAKRAGIVDDMFIHRPAIKAILVRSGEAGQVFQKKAFQKC
jgi:hypothetical protein